MGATGVLAGVSVAGSLLSAQSSRAAGRAAKKQADFNAAEQEAAGLISSALVRRDFQLVAASQRNAMAANGIDISTGSAVDIGGDIAMEGEIAAMLERFGFDSSARASRAEGRAARSAGSARATSSILGGFRSAISILDGKDFGGSSTGGRLKSKGRIPS